MTLSDARLPTIDFVCVLAVLTIDAMLNALELMIYAKLNNQMFCLLETSVRFARIIQTKILIRIIISEFYCIARVSKILIKLSLSKY